MMQRRRKMKSQLNKIYIIIFIILFFTLSKSNAIEDVKKRKKLLEDYKLQIANLKKKLKLDAEKEEDEKSIE
jgi:hypothetical protein